MHAGMEEISESTKVIKEAQEKTPVPVCTFHTSRLPPEREITSNETPQGNSSSGNEASIIERRFSQAVKELNGNASDIMVLELYLRVQHYLLPEEHRDDLIEIRATLEKDSLGLTEDEE